MRILLVFTLFLIGIELFGYSLPPNQDAPLIDHLIEVNVNWQDMMNDETYLCKEVRFESDIDRIHTHLLYVVESLKRKLKLSKKSYKKAFLIEALERYANRKVFPINTYHNVRRPYFVDDYGTHCAVGHIMALDQQDDLVALIKQNDNYAYLEDLTKYEELGVWAAKVGFELSELAWIQPAYMPLSRNIEPVGNNVGADGEISVIRNANNYLIFGGNFTEIEGVQANGIVLMDSEDNFTALGQGLTGDIDEILYSSGDIIVSGHFVINDLGQSSFLARYRDGLWSNIIDYSWSGELNDIEIHSLSDGSEKLIIAGDFSNINSVNYQNFGVFDLQNNVWLTTENHCIPKTNGTIRSLHSYDGKTYLAGDFTKVFTECLSITIEIETSGIAYLQGENLEISEDNFQGPYSSVEKIHKDETGLLVYEILEESQKLHVYKNEVWQTIPVLTYEEGASPILNGFSSFQNQTFIFGIVDNPGIVLTFGNNGLILDNSNDNLHINSVFVIDGQITAADYFNGMMYFAGEFSEIQSKTYPGLAKTDFSFSTNINLVDNQNNAPKLIGINNSAISIENLYQEQESEFNIYNLRGQQIYSVRLPPYIDHKVLSLPYNLTGGIYFYSISKKNKYYSGNLALF